MRRFWIENIILQLFLGCSLLSAPDGQANPVCSNSIANYDDCHLSDNTSGINDSGCRVYLDGANTCQTVGFVYTNNFCVGPDASLYSSFGFSQARCTCPGSDTNRPWRGASDSLGCTNKIPVPQVQGCCTDNTAVNYNSNCPSGSDKAPMGAADPYVGFCVYPTPSPTPSPSASPSPTPNLVLSSPTPSPSPLAPPGPTPTPSPTATPTGSPCPSSQFNLAGVCTSCNGGTILGLTCSCPSGTTFNHLYNGGSCVSNCTEGGLFPDCTCTTPGAIAQGTACNCPAGYSLYPNAASSLKRCRPDAIGDLARNDLTDGYPVCGAGRVPVEQNFNSIYSTADGAFAQSRMGKPATAHHYTLNYTNGSTPLSNNYDFAIGGPNYMYKDTIRCACSMHAASAADFSSDITGSLYSATGAFRGDRYGDVNKPMNALIASPAAAIAIAPNASDNGALSSFYLATTGASKCGCANENEKMKAISTGISGTSCETLLDLSDALTDKFKIFVPYDPSGHAAQVFTPDAMINPLRNITIPTGNLASGGTQSYRRKIWTCSPPFEPSFAGGTIKCVFNASHHVCDDGTASGQASVVSSRLNGSTDALRFQNAVNKKLACCTNVFDPAHPEYRQKFDCVENANTAYGSFDALWTSADATTAGSQPNAVILTNGSNQLLTGFYSQTGARCQEYSEFAGAIKPAIINQAVVSGQQSNAVGTKSLSGINYSGSALTPPALNLGGGGAGWNDFISHKAVPTTASEMRRCPILARAALKVKCAAPMGGFTSASVFPDNNPVSSMIESYFDGTTTRCTAGAIVQVILRIEQIYEIAGQARMETIDAQLNPSEAATVDISALVQAKTAGNCPTGATLMTDGTCSF